MRAIDTNLIVRLVARDDPQQLRLATQIITDGNVLVLPAVLLEAEWVLRARYGLQRRQIAEGLTTICGQEGVTSAFAGAVAASLAAYAGAGDFADLLHYALAAEFGATAFATFDRSFAALDEGPRLQPL